MSSFFYTVSKRLNRQLLVLLLLPFSVLANNPHSKIGGTKPKEVSGFAVADYTITTTGGNVIITDVSGNSETLTVSENGGSNIRFNVPGRTYQIDAGAVTAFNSTPADIALATTTSITINTAAGSDNINIGAFTLNTMPSLTINGGTGNDVVNFNGDITFAANADLDVDLQNDDTNPGIDAITIATDANLLLSGTGTATVKVSKNVLVSEGGSLETVNGNLTVEANQQAAPTAGDFRGVRVRGSLLQSTGSGLVTIKGKGGDNADGEQYGVYIQEGGKVSGGTGSLMVTGTGGASEGDANYGVCVHQPNSLITSSGGNVNVTGQGGGSGASGFNRGVFAYTNGVITAGSSGTVTVEGTGGATTGNGNHGIGLNAGGRITSSGGNVSVIGQGGGSDASDNNYGVYFIEGGVITAGGNGTVTVQGTGGAATGSDNFGVLIERGNSRIISSGGNVSVIGKEGGGLNGIGIVTIGIFGSSAAINTATNGGNIALIANSIDIQNNTSVSTNTTGSLTLHPFTNNTAIDLGSATNPIGGPLSLSDVELDRMTTGTLIIGDANSGAITVSADITRPAVTAVQLISAGDVILSGGGINTNGGTLFLDPGTTPAAVKPTFNGTDVTASTLSFGSDLALAINGTTPGTQYDQLKVVGIVDLSGVTLKLSGTPSPALAGGETFILVDNDNTDAIVGTFTGLVQGATISNFLGSALNATISYTGGTGNDVVISVAAPLPADYTLTTTGNIVTLTDVSGNGETLTVSENGGNIRFNVAGRTYSLDGGATASFPVDVPLSEKTGIVLNTANGADIINVGAFTANLPSLTVNGGTGNDVVNFNGDITFAANASLDVDLQNDDVNPGVDAVTIAANANLLLSGTGTATVKVSKNVLVRGSLETVNGNLVMEANQQATPTAGSFNGVDVINAGGLLQSTGSGSVTIKGKGGDDAGGSQFGVRLILGGKINGGTGSLTVTGTGGNSEGNYNHGVHLHSSLITSSGGNVTVTGTGAGSGASISSQGVFVNVASQITAGGMGSVTVTGNAGSTATGVNNIGVLVQSTDSRITSSGGNVSVTGSGGGSASSATNSGVGVGSAGQITAGGMGTVTVTGTGGTTSGNQNHGVFVLHDNSLITSSGGNVTVIGIGGGSGASNQNNGIIVAAGGRITAGSTGTVTLTGTGGASSGNENIGILVSPTSQITSSGGNVSVTGKEGGGLSGYGIATQTSGSITTATNGGNITLIANSMDIQSGPISTNTGGTLTLRPFTNNTAIDLGSSTNTIGGPLSLHDTELDRMTTGTFIIGDATCGAITVSASITRPAATNVQLISGGDVSLSGGGFNTNGGTLLLDPGTFPAAVKPTFNGTDVTASTLSFGSDLALTINGTTPGTQYDQLKVAGSIDLTGVTLKLSGAPSPALAGGEIFTIVDNDGIDAITGTFTGLAQGATINNFLGSGLNATITYSGGSGNDVVLSVACPSIPAPTASVTAQPTCTTPAGMIVVTAPTGTDIQYSVGGAYQTSATFGSLAPSSYNVTAKNTTTGCVSTALPLTINAVPNAPATPTASVTSQPSCTTPTGTIVVTAPTGADIQYSLGGAYQASATFTGLSPNSYNVTAKNTTTGCISTALPLTVNAVPNAPAIPTASVTSQPTCMTPTGTIVITTHTGEGIQYSIGGEYQASATFSGLMPTTYTVTAKNTTTGCVSLPLSLTVNAVPEAPALPTASVTIQPNCTTPTGTIVITAPTGENIHYSIGGEYQPSATFSGLAPNTYQVTAQNTATGCTSAPLTLTVNAVPIPPVISQVSNELCTGQTLTLSPTSGGTWSSGNPGLASVTNEGLVTGLSAGVVNFTFTATATGCSATTTNVTIKQTPSSNLTASKADVCPNTEVTLNPNCSLPNATVNWNPGAPTVTPNAATIPYVYKASCVAEGCVGNETSVEVRTHRILVDMKDLDAGVLPLPIVRSVKDNMAPTNVITAPVFPRRWTFLANGCDASESAVFTLSGPVNFMTIDNAATYAMFANDAEGFYSLDHPNYGNGGSFPNGTYTLTVDLRSADGVGGPFPKNRVAAGSLLAGRSLQFTVGSPSARVGISPELSPAGSEPLVQVIPNPVMNTMRLDISEAQGKSVQIQLLDVGGRRLLQRSFVPLTNQHQEEFEVSQLANGIYFLQVKTPDIQTTLKVIKVQ